MLGVWSLAVPRGRLRLHTRALLFLVGVAAVFFVLLSQGDSASALVTGGGSLPLDEATSPVREVVRDATTPVTDESTETPAPAPAEVERAPAQAPPAIESPLALADTEETLDPVTRLNDADLEPAPVVDPVAPVDAVTTRRAPAVEEVGEVVKPSAPVVEVGEPLPPAVDDVVQPIVPVVDDVVQPIVPVVDEVVRPVAAVVEDVARPLGPAVESVVEPLGPVVERVTDPLAPVVDEVVRPVVAVVEDVARPLGPVVEPLGPVVERVTEPLALELGSSGPSTPAATVPGARPSGSPAPLAIGSEPRAPAVPPAPSNVDAPLIDTASVPPAGERRSVPDSLRGRSPVGAHPAPAPDRPVRAPSSAPAPLAPLSTAPTSDSSPRGLELPAHAAFLLGGVALGLELMRRLVQQTGLPKAQHLSLLLERPG